MEDQLTIRITRQLSKALKERAAQTGRKPSELVRMAVTEFLQIAEQPSESPAERVRNVIGSVRSGVPDLALRHRQYIIKKLRRGR